MRTHLPKIGGILLMLLIIGSCKKDYQNGEIPEQEPNNKLQQWYNASLKVADQNTFSNLKPVWKTTYAAQVGEQIVYEVEFASPEKFIVKSADNVRSISGGVENLDMEVHRHNVKLLLFEDALTGDIRNAAYMAIESNVSANFGSLHYKDLGNFTGKVYFHHFNGKLSNGWVYQNGKIISQLSNITKAQYDYEQKFAAQGKQTNAITCYTSYADNYMYVCVYINGYYNDCRWQYAGSSYYSACSFTEPSSIGDVNGSGGGYTDQPLEPDCAGVLGGTAYIDLNCNECIGGTTGKTSCTKDIIDSLKNYTCAQALLKQLPTLKNDIAQLIKKTFGVSDVKNIIFKADSTLIGTAKDGTHYSFPNYVSGVTTEQRVGLNPDILNYGTKEYILVTMYHEALHAYFAYKKQELGSVVFANQFSGLTVNGGRLLFVEKNGHFEMAASNYLLGLRDAILSFNKTMDPDVALALAKAGIVQLTQGESTTNANERDVRKGLYSGTKC
jgi:hypothetical protein